MVLEINNLIGSFFLVAEFAPEHIKLNETKHHYYQTEYNRIHDISSALHFISLVILCIMLVEVSLLISLLFDCVLLVNNVESLMDLHSH